MVSAAFGVFVVALITSFWISNWHTGGHPEEYVTNLGVNVSLGRWWFLQIIISVVHCTHVLNFWDSLGYTLTVADWFWKACSSTWTNCWYLGINSQVISGLFQELKLSYLLFIKLNSIQSALCYSFKSPCLCTLRFVSLQGRLLPPEKLLFWEVFIWLRCHSSPQQLLFEMSLTCQLLGCGCTEQLFGVNVCRSTTARSGGTLKMSMHAGKAALGTKIRKFSQHWQLTYHFLLRSICCHCRCQVTRQLKGKGTDAVWHLSVCLVCLSNKKRFCLM